ncbi:MAG TPA: hypothetical protein PK771_16035, partial [Spirochaetota bacterium]|nr:hypothetical protein [Spirochaetota bacterium]
MPVLERRVTVLETMMKDLVYIVTKSERKHEEFKKEMLEFKVEMKEFKDEMKEFKNEMLEFKDEMKEFKKDSNKKWGDLSRSLGMIAENIVIPNLEYIAKKYFNLNDYIYFVERIKRNYKKNGEFIQKEFDGIIFYEDAILINETKTFIKMDYVADFVDFVKSNEIFDFFPEAKNKRVIPIFSS